MKNFEPKFAPVENYQAPFNRLPMKTRPAADTDHQKECLCVEQSVISEFLSADKVDFLKPNIREVYSYINNVFDCYCLEENSPEWDELCAIAWELKYRFALMIKNNKTIRDFIYDAYSYLDGRYGSNLHDAPQNLFRIYAEMAQKAI